MFPDIHRNYCTQCTRVELRSQIIQDFKCFDCKRKIKREKNKRYARFLKYGFIIKLYFCKGCSKKFWSSENRIDIVCGNCGGLDIHNVDKKQ